MCKHSNSHNASKSTVRCNSCRKVRDLDIDGNPFGEWYSDKGSVDARERKEMARIQGKIERTEY